MVLLMKDVEVILPTILVTRPLSLRQQQGDISVWQHKSHGSSIKTTIQRILFIKHMGLAHRSKTQGHWLTRPLTWNVRNQHYNLDFNVLCNQFGVGMDPWVVLGIFHYRIYLGEWYVLFYINLGIICGMWCFLNEQTIKHHCVINALPVIYPCDNEAKQNNKSRRCCWVNNDHMMNILLTTIDKSSR